MIINPDSTETDQVISSRHSVRGFLPKAVETSTVEQILNTAARAPSGTNTQPWKAYVATGSALKRLSRLFLPPTTIPNFNENNLTNIIRTGLLSRIFQGGEKLAGISMV